MVPQRCLVEPGCRVEHRTEEGTVGQRPRSTALSRSLWVAFTLAATLTPPNLSGAQEAPTGQECAPDYDGPRRVVMDHDGQPGVWVAAPVMNCMVRDLRELPLLHERVRLLDQRLELRDEQVADLRRAVELGIEAEGRLVESIEQAVAARRAAEERVDVWWRSPTLWLSVGVVLTAGLVALTAYALDAATE